MSKQRLQLQGSRDKQEKVRRRLFDGLFDGRSGLPEALGLDPSAIAELRAQAQALYAQGRWARCIAMVQGLHALGDQELWDPVMLSRCYDELGDPEQAVVCARIAETLLALATSVEPLEEVRS